MRRRYRRSVLAAYRAQPISPLFRTIAFLFVLVLFYSWAKRPQSWQWLEENVDETSATVPAESLATRNAPGSPDAPSKSDDTIVPGPTDQEPEQAASAQNLFQAVSDREPLSTIEMPAYWRCFKWARAQSFAELERRATKHIAYTQLWEQPAKYRGQLIRLRLHLRRVLEPWAASENSAGVKQVYEAWGFTDESKSYPYLVLFSELPAGMKIGDNVQEDGLFVGYFLKNMKYTAFDKNRSAPLLIGRMHLASTASVPTPVVTSNDWKWLISIGIPVAILCVYGVWWQRQRAKRIRNLANTAPANETEMENWFRNSEPSSATDDPFANGNDLPQ